MSDRLLVVPELAEILRLHEDTVREWAREGRIPGALKPGGEWRFPEASVIEWIASGGAAAAKAARGLT